MHVRMSCPMPDIEEGLCSWSVWPEIMDLWWQAYLLMARALSDDGIPLYQSGSSRESDQQETYTK